MWTTLKTPIEATDHKEKPPILVSINTEYLSVFRTQSYAEFFSKAQFLITDQPSSSSKAAELLLKPEQDSIPSLLNSLGSISDLKILMLRYFDTSAVASRMCPQLLRAISAGHDTYRFIDNSLDSFSASSPNELSSIVSNLSSIAYFTNPFSAPTQQQFKLIHDEYISIFHHLKSKRKQVTRRRKMVEYSKKAIGVCLTAGCTVLAVAAIGTFPRHLPKNWRNVRWFRSRALRKAGEQIDAAAKGTYIMNRDFDTMSRLVDRLHDEVERIKGMIRFWLLREDRFSLQEVVKELRRSGRGLKKQVQELEERVCLSLVNINKVKVSVMEKISLTKTSQ